MTRANAARRTVERAALLAAQEQFLQWRTAWRDVPPVDRLAFSGLLSAVKRLQAALQRFGPAAPAYRAELLLQLQGGQALKPQWHYAEQLEELDLLLGHLHLAALARVGKGRRPAPYVREWIWIAADQWVATVGKQPSAKDEAPFLKALLSLQEDRQARSPALPKVTQSTVEAALLMWRANKESARP